MVSNLPLISVLIPVYNVEAFVREAVLSICNQTYKNIEIIVVDDCSTDNTYNVVSELARIDSRIILLKNENNLKIVKTLNFALDNASGDFIARMDGDDISAPQRLEKQLNFLLRKTEVDLVGSNFITIDEQGNVIGKQKMPTSQEIINKTLKLVSPVPHIWLARRKVYEILDGYREIPGAEDYDFLLRMHSDGMLFTNIDSYEYSVRLRNGNTTSTIGFNQRLMANYVLELYNMRKNNKYDNYSLKDINNYLIKYQNGKFDFDKSNNLLVYALKLKNSKKFFKMFFYILLASMTSKYQFQYLRRRLCFKFIVFLFLGPK